MKQIMNQFHEPISSSNHRQHNSHQQHTIIESSSSSVLEDNLDMTSNLFIWEDRVDWNPDGCTSLGQGWKRDMLGIQDFEFLLHGVLHGLQLI